AARGSQLAVAGGRSPVRDARAVGIAETGADPLPPSWRGVRARRRSGRRAPLRDRRDRLRHAAGSAAEAEMTHFGPCRTSEQLSGILHRALREAGMAKRLPRRVSPGLWESAVGRQIAARAQPTVLSGGILHILVQDHCWRDQLDAARVMLLERLNRKLGKNSVRALQFGLAHEGALDQARRRAG